MIIGIDFLFVFVRFVYENRINIEKIKIISYKVRSVESSHEGLIESIQHNLFLQFSVNQIEGAQNK